MGSTSINVVLVVRVDWILGVLSEVGVVGVVCYNW